MTTDDEDDDFDQSHDAEEIDVGDEPANHRTWHSGKETPAITWYCSVSPVNSAFAHEQWQPEYITGPWIIGFEFTARVRIV